MSSFQLIAMMATMMPEETLIERLEEKLTNYKLAPSEDTRRECILSLQLVSMRLMNEDQGRTDISDVLKDAREMEENAKLSMKIMKPDEN
jgi:hypothetical protein